MVDYSVTNYNPYNMYQNYGYYYPSFNSTYSQQYQNVPLYDFNTINYNYNNKPDTVSFSANSYIQPEQKKQGMSTGAKVVIGAGIITALAVGADFLFCKGKHVKSIFGKAGNKGGNSAGKPNVKPANTSPPSASTPANTNVTGTCSTQVSGQPTPAIQTSQQSTAGHRMTIGKVTNPYTGHRYRLYNRTPQDLKKECDAFKLATGAELHVPSTMASDLFGDACIVLERAAKDGNFPKDIKHVLVGHGYGSSVNGDWNIINGGGNVLNYIANNPNIKEGEKVLVLCCESYGTVRGRNGIGGTVILSLTDSLHPAKIVVKGQNKIGGELYFTRLLEGNTKPSVYMYSDKPAFTIKKK